MVQMLLTDKFIGLLWDQEYVILHDLTQNGGKQNA